MGKHKLVCEKQPIDQETIIVRRPVVIYGQLGYCVTKIVELSGRKGVWIRYSKHQNKHGTFYDLKENNFYPVEISVLEFNLRYYPKILRGVIKKNMAYKINLDTEFEVRISKEGALENLIYEVPILDFKHKR